LKSITNGKFKKANCGSKTMVLATKRLMASLLVILLIGLTITIQAGESKSKHNEKKPAQPAIERKPYTIEINEDSTRQGIVVTLAVGSFTVFRCPEPPTQILKGFPEAFYQKESAEGHNNSSVYLTATLPDVRTNIFLEMKSISIDIQVRTIAIKGGAQVGDYNGEVLIKPQRYNEDLAAARKELVQAKEEIAQLNTKITELGQEAQGKVIENTDKSALDFLSLLENNQQPIDKTAAVDLAGGRIRVYQIGRAVKTAQGWVVLFQIENRSKELMTLDDIKVDHGNIKTNGTTAKRLNARQDARIALLIQPTQENEAPSQLSFVINGTATSVRLKA
jgi:hypothetical protein